MRSLQPRHCTSEAAGSRVSRAAAEKNLQATGIAADSLHLCLRGPEALDVEVARVRRKGVVLHDCAERRRLLRPLLLASGSRLLGLWRSSCCRCRTGAARSDDPAANTGEACAARRADPSCSSSSRITTRSTALRLWRGRSQQAACLEARARDGDACFLALAEAPRGTTVLRGFLLTGGEAPRRRLRRKQLTGTRRRMRAPLRRRRRVPRRGRAETACAGVCSFPE